MPPVLSPANQTSQIRLGTTIMLTISSVSNEQIPVEVVAVNQTDRESDAAVILQSDYNQYSPQPRPYRDVPAGNRVV